MPPNQEPITPRPHGGIGHVAPYFPLDGHSHNPSFNFDSLHARNEFYYESNESIKSISKHQIQKKQCSPILDNSTWMCLIFGYISLNKIFTGKQNDCVEVKKVLKISKVGDLAVQCSGSFQGNRMRIAQNLLSGLFRCQNSL